MKQAIHIFRKDLLYLWREVWVVLLLAVMFVYAVTARGNLAGISGILLEAAACWLIARLIHAETLVGDNQFWITRPYEWKALLGAKVAFIFAFVQMPILLIHLAILITIGSPLWRNLPGLLWEQLLFWICMSLPLATLAAITSGLTPLILTILVVPVAGLAVDLYFPVLGILTGTVLGPLEWVKDTIAGAGVAAIAVVVLYFQYRKRATACSRIFLAAAAALVLLVFMYLPWRVAFGVQSRLPSQGFNASSLQIGLAEPGPLPGLQMLLAVDGVPAGDDIRADAVNLEFHWMDGQVSTYQRVGLDRPPAERNVFRVIASLKSLPSLPDLDGPVTIRGTFYLTLFGNARSRTIPLQNRPVNVIDSLQCNLDWFPATRFECLAPFRWPEGIVSATFSRNDTRPLGEAVSYSPFPAELGLDPVEGRVPFGSPSYGTEATLTIKEPIAHVRRDFSLGEVHISGLRNIQISR